MRQEIVRITDCNRCPYREAETDEYPSDRCTLSGWGLHQHTSGDFNRPIPVPSSCPLRKKDHVVKINLRYTLGGDS